MIRKIALLVFFVTTFLVTPVQATTTKHILSIGRGIDYVLPVEEPQILANPFLWTIKVTCKIKSESDNNLISFKVTRKSGTFNGTKLSAGDSMTVNLHANEKIYITAVPGGEVELVNLSSQVIHAECDVS